MRHLLASAGRSTHEKGPAVAAPPGLLIQFMCPDWTGKALEDAEHDGSDKGEGNVGGDNAQSADESHGSAPFVHVVPQSTLDTSKPFPTKKVRFPVRCPLSTGGTGSGLWLKTREINALKSP